MYDGNEVGGGRQGWVDPGSVACEHSEFELLPCLLGKAHAPHVE